MFCGRHVMGTQSQLTIAAWVFSLLRITGILLRRPCKLAVAYRN